MRKISNNSLIAIRRKIDRFLSCEDDLIIPDIKDNELLIKQILKKKNLFWIYFLSIFLSIIISFFLFCGITQG